MQLKRLGFDDWLLSFYLAFSGLGLGFIDYGGLILFLEFGHRFFQSQQLVLDLLLDRFGQGFLSALLFGLFVFFIFLFLLA